MTFRNASHPVRLLELVRRLIPSWSANGRLIDLPVHRDIVYVGDIHGDRKAVELLFERFPLGSDMLVFLGDILDRGPDSIGSLSLILERQLEAPDETILLMGNHEAWAATQFKPAGFWLSLAPQDAIEIADGLGHLPYAARHPSGLFAAHGALPDVSSMDGIREAVLGSAAWRALTWGDWSETPGATPQAASRPLFDRQAFDERAAQLGVQAMIRSHQPTAPMYLFDDRCLTLFTTTSYGDGERRVARLSARQSINSARDLELLSL